jgi:hypothetical protein
MPRLNFDDKDEFMVFFGQCNPNKYHLIVVKERGAILMVPSVSTKSLNIGTYKPVSPNELDSIVALWTGVVLRIATIDWDSGRGL